MSTDNNNNNNTAASPPVDRQRRGSVSSAAFANLFQRSNSTSQPASTVPGPITSAAMNDQRRRLSITTMGLTGTSPNNQNAPATAARRASLSTTNSDSIEENAVEEEEAAAGPHTNPNTPYGRRMSFGANAMRNMRPSGSPGSANDQGFNWSEQLRSRAESIASGGPRASFSMGNGLPGSPPRGSMSGPPREPRHHDRAKSVSDLPNPPAQAASMKPKQDPRPKPDHFQERILKGDFYMD